MARRISTAVVILASVGVVAPASAQFGTIFGDFPPRPPASVPGGRPLPPPDPDVVPQDRLPPGPPPGRIQTQPLPPPPGAARAPDPNGQPLDTTRGGQPPSAQIPAAPGQTLPGLPPGQRQPRGAPPPPGQPPAQPASAPANVPNEVIVEPPAQKLANPTAVFSGLDKITGRIIEFEVAINETVRFGALEVTPRVCYTRPPTETQLTDGFVEVDELTLQGELKRIFTGWMFVTSPGLNAVEHPIYDVWLKDCKGAAAPAVAEVPEPAPQQKPQPQRRQQPQQAQPRRTQAPSPAQPQLPPPPFR